MDDFRADLHCHSTCSDGTLTPEEIVTLAAETGLKGLSITDHDTIAAYEVAMPFAAKLGIQLTSGIEFSAMHRGTSIHILGYSFSLKASSIIELCKKHCDRRNNRNLGILERLKKRGMLLDLSELENSTTKNVVGRPHIAQMLLEKGYVASIQEAFYRFIGEGKPCYIPGEGVSVEETLEAIHDGKGLAVLAHPHLIKNSSLLKELLKLDFEGIEVYYSLCSAAQNSKFFDLAQKHNLLVTGGSDFHGSVKPHLQLGRSFVGEREFTPLLSHFQKNNITTEAENDREPE